MALSAGLMARSVDDVEFLDAILSDCPSKRPEISLKGLRVGYPREWWRDLGHEVSFNLYIIH